MIVPDKITEDLAWVLEYYGYYPYYMQSLLCYRREYLNNMGADTGEGLYKYINQSIRKCYNAKH